MKKILITGAHSYIGMSLEYWLNQWPDSYSVDTLDMKNLDWITHSFRGYDVIFHVAAIVHQNGKKIDESVYYKVNTELPTEVAQKAKNEGVRQFIFLSSMSVYGDHASYITHDTLPHPTSSYGKSKLMAENHLEDLSDNNFKIAILRPPMVYGFGAKGNYLRLSKLTQFTLFFPKWTNKRSMIYIDNLCEFVKNIIDFELEGHFFPQNKNYISTAKMVEEIAKVNNKRIYFLKILNYLILLLWKVRTIKKVFGNLVYDQNMSHHSFNYHKVSFKDSIYLTEKENRKYRC